MNQYDRIARLCNNQTQGEDNNLIMSAILNLKLVNDIIEFTEGYKRHHPEIWKNDIAYALGFFDQSDRELWNDAIGSVVGISVLMNRSERELWTEFEYIDAKGKVLEKYKNTNVGMHQNESVIR